MQILTEGHVWFWRRHISTTISDQSPDQRHSDSVPSDVFFIHPTPTCSPWKAVSMKPRRMWVKRPYVATLAHVELLWDQLGGRQPPAVRCLTQRFPFQSLHSLILLFLGWITTTRSFRNHPAFILQDPRLHALPSFRFSNNPLYLTHTHTHSDMKNSEEASHNKSTSYWTKNN